MRRLSQRSIAPLLEFIRNLYVVREREAFISHLLISLPKLIPADVASFNEADPLTRRSRTSPGRRSTTSCYTRSASTNSCSWHSPRAGCRSAARACIAIGATFPKRSISRWSSSTRTFFRRTTTRNG